MMTDIRSNISDPEGGRGWGGVGGGRVEGVVSGGGGELKFAFCRLMSGGQLDNPLLQSLI